MSREAVGAYIATLRWEGLQLTQKELAQVVGPHLSSGKISDRVITNYETGVNMPGLEVLSVLLAVLGGSFDHVQALMGAGVTKEEGEAQARQWLRSGGRSAVFERDADEAARIVQSLTRAGENDLAEQYLGIGRRLLPLTSTPESASVR